jgi:hypothetical protein
MSRREVSTTAADTSTRVYPVQMSAASHYGRASPEMPSSVPLSVLVSPPSE